MREQHMERSLWTLPLNLKLEIGRPPVIEKVSALPVGVSLFERDLLRGFRLFRELGRELGTRCSGLAWHLYSKMVG